jgi:YbbR domain-containing protein
MKDLLLHNWHLKLISLVLATALWAAVARQPSSEIGVSVSLEYQNIPARTELLGDTTDRVEVRLRGASSLLRTLTAQDIFLPIDVSGLALGQERVVSLRPEMVHAPLGIEVVRVIPSQVRIVVEPTTTKRVRIEPKLSGIPEPGFMVEKVLASPDTLDIEGPESHIQDVDTIQSTVVDVRGRKGTFRETAALDISDPVIRVIRPSPIVVEVQIRSTP